VTKQFSIGKIAPVDLLFRGKFLVNKKNFLQPNMEATVATAS
jgi:hypothetical protein